MTPQMPDSASVLDDITREFCGRCSRLSPVGFHSPLWRAVAGRWEHDILCLTCFTTLGDEKGISWEEGIEFRPVSFVTHREMAESGESLMERLARANPVPLGERCRECGRPYDLVWAAENDLWNEVIGSSAGMLCPDCFNTEAEARGIHPFFACFREHVNLDQMAEACS